MWWFSPILHVLHVGHTPTSSIGNTNRRSETSQNTDEDKVK